MQGDLFFRVFGDKNLKDTDTTGGAGPAFELGVIRAAPRKDPHVAGVGEAAQPCGCLFVEM